MSSKGSMGPDVFPDAPALPFGSGRRLWPKSGGPGLSALAPLLGLSSNLPDDLGLYGRALHLDLHWRRVPSRLPAVNDAPNL